MADTRPAPATPGLEFAFSIIADIAAPLSGGAAPGGERLHIAITGGRVAGAGLKGDILPGGSDWPLIRPDGTSEISATYSIRTEDGTPILVRNRGLRVSSGEVMTRLRAGEPVPPGDYYFRSAPVFEAPPGPHAWLNDTLFVASLAPAGRSIRIDVYRVI